MAVQLSDSQIKAIKELRNGSVLNGGVGSGKSRTLLGYYILKVTEGKIKINGKGSFSPMKKPRDLYIITTAMKRDSLEWDQECAAFGLGKNPDENVFGTKVFIDSWNNIKKYQKVFGAFFIFDEQRVVGKGVWVKSFLDIAQKNQWVLASATPGDQWGDYIPVFIANGFYKNRTEFEKRHIIYARFSKYPKIERYVDEETLQKYRDSVLVRMEDQRLTKRHNIYELVEFDRKAYKKVFVDRWDPFEDRPIEETGKWVYLLRKIPNSDPSRITVVDRIFKERKKCIVFYNFSYELEMLREYCNNNNIAYAEWNGEKHQNLPKGKQWLYLVQYNAGAEGWNCITTNTVIFFSQTYSYRVLEQASGRIDRMNTPYMDLYYYHLRSRASIDLAIYEKLKNKKNFNEKAFVERRKK